MTTRFISRIAQMCAVVVQCAFLAACGGSGSSPSAPTGTSSPTPTPTPVAPAPTGPRVATLEIDSSFVGGTGGRGTVTLSAEAPAAGVDVTLSTSDTAITIPATVTVAAGARTGSFTFGSLRVPSTREVTVTASAGGGSQSATVQIRPLATSGTLSFASRGSADYVGQGQSLTFVHPSNKFVGEVRDGNRTVDIRIAVGADFVWGLMVSAPPSQSLTVTRYENTTPYPDRTAQLHFYGYQRGCGDGGRGEFEVLEAEFAPGGTILRFRARFTQACGPADPLLTGEVSVQNLPHIGS